MDESAVAGERRAATAPEAVLDVRCVERCVDTSCPPPLFLILHFRIVWYDWAMVTDLSHVATEPVPPVCPTCHQATQPDYYFCPNCGENLRQKPLSITVATQTWMYFLSIVMPSICFLAIRYWPGVKYARSKDPQAHMIGIVACILLVLSTFLTYYYAYVWTVQFVQEASSSLNASIGI